MVSDIFRNDSLASTHPREVCVERAVCCILQESKSVRIWIFSLTCAVFLWQLMFLKKHVFIRLSHGLPVPFLYWQSPPAFFSLMWSQVMQLPVSHHALSLTL